MLWMYFPPVLQHQVVRTTVPFPWGLMSTSSISLLPISSYSSHHLLFSPITTLSPGIINQQPTSLSQLQNCATLPPLASSDHLGVSLTIKWKPISPPSNHQPRSVWVYKDADFIRANELIQSTDWDSLISGDVDQSAERWTQQFLEIMEKCIPRQHLKKRKQLPWLSSNIVKHIKKRNALFQEASKTKDDSQFNKYKRMRNKVVDMIRGAKKKFFSLMTPSNKQF